MHVNGVARDVGTVDVAHAVANSCIPNLNVLIPAARDNQIRVFSDELCTEDTVGVTRETTAATLESLLQLAGLLVIDSDFAVFACRKELQSIRFIVTGHQTVARVVNFVQLTARSRVEVVECAISIGCNHDIFGNSWSFKWSPSICKYQQISDHKF